MKKITFIYIICTIITGPLTTMEKEWDIEPVVAKQGLDIIFTTKDGQTLSIARATALNIPTLKTLMSLAEHNITSSVIDAHTMQTIIRIVKDVYNYKPLLDLDPLFFQSYNPTDIPAIVKQIVQKNIQTQTLQNYESLIQTANFLGLQWLVNYNTDAYSIADLVVLNKLPNLTNNKILALTHKNITSLAGIHIIPHDIRLNIRSINLTNNRIGSIPDNIFAVLPDLTNLYLVNNQINTITTNSFAGLRALQVLSLANNKLEVIPARAFHELHNLQELTISHNQLTTIENDAFVGLDTLKKLWLYNNSIASLTPTTFAGLDNIQFIRLNNNKISIITPDVFINLRRLRKLWLNNNFIDQATKDRIRQALPNVQIIFE